MADIDELLSIAVKKFQNLFQSKPNIYSFAPGRVNLIGEHVDYNEGFVLPMALSLVTVIVGRKNSSNTCHILTDCSEADDPKEITFEIPDGEQKFLHPGKPAWANYVKGVIANYKGHVSGFDALITTTVPIGGGLSSSAALEVATHTFLEGLDDETPDKISRIEKILTCQKAEHEFSGTPCGIMDQFVSVMGRKNHGLLLDCRSLTCKYLKMENPNIAVLITNTNVHHKLAESQYASRKKQCENAVTKLQKSLRDVTADELLKYKEDLGEDTYRRAYHVVTEIARTINAAKALQEENFELFGMLMNQSHVSLRDNYEVSCPELDTVVNAALEVKGVYGARMTGGGFGGCTVTLVQSTAIEDVKNNIRAKYDKVPTFYVCCPGDGAQLGNIQ